MLFYDCCDIIPKEFRVMPPEEFDEYVNQIIKEFKDIARHMDYISSQLTCFTDDVKVREEKTRKLVEQTNKNINAICQEYNEKIMCELTEYAKLCRSYLQKNYTPPRLLTANSETSMLDEEYEQK